ncbi:hypothetical protein EA772_01670 [Pedobacter sp. G11]|uniref:cysteine peptidase family C39 domain-containing protein n=1 Tax=Pedobacter sp. G11 TaxID=2482728 RepID=UPI000F5E41F7|nr:cysteine peptidase family C39 domain-containing protein [Pedobacter sp. G11]AZI24113.1 hypothetical protein EA772_01670 [Pedobacter sp. G11]
MRSLFKPKQSNATEVVDVLLKSLNIKVSSGTVKKTLEDHPEYPSLLAISDSLKEWHVENDAYRIDKEDYNPSDLLYPFLAHTQHKGGMFIIVNKIENGQVVYSDEDKKNGVISEESFLKAWTGVALYAAAKPTSGEKRYFSNKLQDSFGIAKFPLLIMVLFMAIWFSMDKQQLTSGYVISIFLKLIGVGVSVLLLLHSIDANNPLVQNLCSLGSKNSCNAVLKSDAAKLTSWLSWSEIGFFYFTGSFLSLLLVPSSAPVIVWLNIFALPYTIYSLSYQYSRRNWCLLCCTVQAILLAEFLSNFFTGSILNPGSLDDRLIIEIALCFLIPILVWSALKPFFTKATLIAPLKNQLKKFKFNSDLFDEALRKQPSYAVTDDLMPIRLGNPEAQTIITIVSNPFCEPCAKAHRVIDEWLTYRDDIQLKIIFSTADHDDDQKTMVSRHVSALSLSNDPALLERALNDWYGQNKKKYENWAQKYPVELGDNVSQVTQRQKEWCEMADISVTPTVLVNGRKLPEAYRLEDIKYLLG